MFTSFLISWKFKSVALIVKGLESVFDRNHRRQLINGILSYKLPFLEPTRPRGKKQAGNELFANLGQFLYQNKTN